MTNQEIFAFFHASKYFITVSRISQPEAQKSNLVFPRFRYKDKNIIVTNTLN